MTNLLNLNVLDDSALEEALTGPGATVSGMGHAYSEGTLNIIHVVQSLTKPERRNLALILAHMDTRQTA